MVVEVRALCRPVQFFHTIVGKPFLYVPGFVHCQVETGKGLPWSVATKFDHKLAPEKYLHPTEFKVYSLQLGREKFLTWEQVKVMGARSAAQRKFSASCTAALYNTVPSVLILIFCRSETFHFPVFLNALIDREYPCCQSKWASCPRLGGDCCSSTEASCLVIQLP